MKVSDRISQFSRTGIWLLMLATVLVVPLVGSPHAGASPFTRPLLFEMLALALVGLGLLQAAPGALWASARRVWAFLDTGPHLPVLLLVVYGAGSWFRSAVPEFSATEWLRLACGAGLYFVVAGALRGRDQIRTIVNLLIAAALVTSLYGLVSPGRDGASGVSAAFGNKQLFAGFLLLLIPLLVAVSFRETDLTRKITIHGAALLALTSLLLSQNRTSWLSLVVALIALAAMLLPRGAAAHALLGRKHQIVLPLAVLAGAVGLFLLVSRTAPLVTARASTLATAPHDPDFHARLVMWQGAWKLVQERPLFGWGIGTFPLEQSRTVPNALPGDLIRRVGPTLSQEAHNEYVQMAAEMGVIGLGLYLWVLGAFFAYGLRTLRQADRGFRRLVLIGCLAALVGQAVDALSNPAWRFADVSFLFWLTMGLGMAAASSLRQAQTEERASVPAGFSRTAVRLGWQAAMFALTISAMAGAWAAISAAPTSCPAPSYILSVSVQPAAANLSPGQCVTFKLLAKTAQGTVDVTSCPYTFFTDQGSSCLKQTDATSTFCAVSKACKMGCGKQNITVTGGITNTTLAATAKVKIIGCGS